MRTALDNSTFVYRGRSMWPSFQDGDLLLVEQVAASQLCCGDCIVFRATPDAHNTMHRVVKICPEIWSRGDAKPCPDDEPVAPESIIGRVRALVRNGGQRSVRGGWLGGLSGKIAYYTGRVDPYSSGRGGRIARVLANICGRPSRRWLRRATTIVLDGPAGTVSHLMLGRRAIARWDEDRCLWVVPWPTSLWLSPDRLQVTGDSTAAQPEATTEPMAPKQKTGH